eukprot:gene641-1073_t
MLESGPEPTRVERQERFSGAHLATVRARESDHRSLIGLESSDSGSEEERVRRALASEPRIPATRLEWVEAPPGFECPSNGALVVYGIEQQTSSSVEGSKLSVQALAWHPKVQSAPPAGSETAKPDLERRVKAFLGRQRQSQLATILGEWNAAVVLAAQRRERGTLAASRREALLLTHAWSDWAENAKQFVRLKHFHAGVRQRQVRAFFSAWQRHRESVQGKKVRWGEVQGVLDHRKERLMRSSWSTWQSHLKASKCDKAKPRASPEEASRWLDVRRGLRYLGRDQEVTGIVWFQHDDHGLSASGSYQLELYQQPLAETKKVLQQKRTDPFNSLERTSFRAFVVNINRPGQLVGRGVSLRDVRNAVRVAVQSSRRRPPKDPPTPPTDKRWANRFALLSSSDEEPVELNVGPREVPRMARVATRRKPTRSRRKSSEDPLSSESTPPTTDRDSRMEPRRKLASPKAPEGPAALATLAVQGDLEDPAEDPAVQATLTVPGGLAAGPVEGPVDPENPAGPATRDALKWALKMISETVDRYDTAVEGSGHAFGPLIRFVRQVRELLDLEPVRYAMMMTRLGPSASGESGQPVLTTHSLMSEEKGIVDRSTDGPRVSKRTDVPSKEIPEKVDEDEDPASVLDAVFEYSDSEDESVPPTSPPVVIGELTHLNGLTWVETPDLWSDAADTLRVGEKALEDAESLAAVTRSAQVRERESATPVGHHSNQATGSHYDRVVDRQDWRLIKERFDEI